MFDFVTIGGATRDIFFKTDKGWVSKGKNILKQSIMCFEYGAKVIPKEAYFSFGGGAVNTAVSFTRLGLKAATIISLGDDENADAALDYLKKERVKVNPQFVRSRGINGTGISVIIVDKGGDHTAILYRGTNNKLKIKNWDWINKTKWVYVSSLTGQSDLILSRLKREISKSKTKLVWNPGHAQFKRGYKSLKGLLSRTHVLILNKDEALEFLLTKRKVKNCNDVRSLIAEIREWGPEIVVITDGKRGTYVSEDSKIFFAPPMKTKVVDTTGAGDAFGSSFVAGLEMYKDTKKALNLASVNASSVVSKYGTQAGLLKISQIRRVKKSVKISEVKKFNKCES